MINIASFNKALKSIWIKKYICKTNIMEQGKPVCDLEVQKCGGKVWLTGNLDKKDTVNQTTEENFFLVKKPLQLDRRLILGQKTRESFLSYPLRFNSLKRTDTCPVFIRNWSSFTI